MRIFPEGARDWLAAGGRALVIIAGCILAIAVGAFLFKTWILYSWPRTSGTVISSRLQTSRSDDGTVLCSAIYSVQYSVDGKDAVAQQGGHTFTNLCEKVRSEVEGARGQHRTVTYYRLAPGSVYVEPGFNIEFYLVAFILTCLAGGLAIFGWVGTILGRWMERKGIELP
jgi:hypothetical protein